MKTKLIVIFSLTLFSIQISSTQINAVTSTGSAVTTASPSALKNIKERVEKVMQTADPQIKGLVSNLKQSRFGITGSLEKIVGSTLQIRNTKGQLRVAELAPDAVLLKGTKPITREELELNSPAIIMGLRGDDQSLQVRRLVILETTPIDPQRLTLFGKVTSIKSNQISISNQIGGTLSSHTLAITSKTSYFNTLDNKIKRTDIVQNDLVVLVTSPEASTSALRVYSLSPKVIPSPNLTSTQ